MQQRLALGHLPAVHTLPYVCGPSCRQQDGELQNTLSELTARLQEEQAAHAQLQATYSAGQAAWAAKEEGLAGAHRWQHEASTAGMSVCFSVWALVHAVTHSQHAFANAACSVSANGHMLVCSSSNTQCARLLLADCVSCRGPCPAGEARRGSGQPGGRQGCCAGGKGGRRRTHSTAGECSTASCLAAKTWLAYPAGRVLAHEQEPLAWVLTQGPAWQAASCCPDTVCCLTECATDRPCGRQSWTAGRLPCRCSKGSLQSKLLA